MDWMIRYQFGDAENLSWHQHLDEAIELACLLMDNGGDVIAIGHQTLDNAVGRSEIERIYSIWLKAKGAYAPCM